MLDSRVLKTPARQPLVLPTRTLALAVAAEWEWQASRIQPFTMPLMSLAATALDEPKPREDVVAAMLQYLPTDSVVCRVEPGPIADQQAKVRQGSSQPSRGLRACVCIGRAGQVLEGRGARLLCLAAAAGWRAWRANPPAPPPPPPPPPPPRSTTPS